MFCSSSFCKSVNLSNVLFLLVLISTNFMGGLRRKAKGIEDENQFWKLTIPKSFQI